MRGYTRETEFGTALAGHKESIIRGDPRSKWIVFRTLGEGPEDTSHGPAAPQVGQSKQSRHIQTFRCLSVVVRDTYSLSATVYKYYPENIMRPVLRGKRLS